MTDSKLLERLAKKIGGTGFGEGDRVDFCNVPTMFTRMKRQTPEEKWNRIQGQMQEDIAKG